MEATNVEKILINRMSTAVWSFLLVNQRSTNGTFEQLFRTFNAAYLVPARKEDDDFGAIETHNARMV